MQKAKLLHLTNNLSRLPVPTLVTYNKTSYELENEIIDETDIGPEVTHIYQVLQLYLCDKFNQVS